jgi:hypothetical protein
MDAIAWELLPASEPFNLGNIPTVVEVDGTLVASGPYQEPPSASNPGFGEPEWRIWISTDGATWEHVFTDRDSYFGGLATDGDSLVALASRVDEPVTRLVISRDLGRTWSEAETEPFVTNSLLAVAAGNGRYVAVGQNVALSSIDGETWTSSATDFGAGPVATQLVTLPNGFLATDVRRDGQPALECRAGGVAVPSIQVLPTEPAASADSEVTFPAETCAPVPGSGGTWVSADGVEWERGADLPQEGLGVGTPYYRIAAGHDALVASFGMIFETAELQNARIWYAPLSDFRP